MTCTSGHAACLMEFRTSVVLMNDAIRRAVEFDLDKSPIGFPMLPYVWRYNKDSKSIRLEMGTADLEDRRVIAMFSFTMNPPPSGLGVIVHVSVWVTTPNADPRASDWAAVHSRNMNCHEMAIKFFKGELLRLQTDAYVIFVPEELPPPPAEAV